MRPARRLRRTFAATLATALVLGVAWPCGVCSADGDPGEPNDTRATATPIACNATTSDAAISPVGDVDFYRLEATAGDVVALDLDPANDSPSFDSVLGVFDDGGHLLFVNDDAVAPYETHGTYSFLEFVAPYSGTYFIGVSAWDDLDFDSLSDSGVAANLTSGAYTLRVDCTTVAPNALVPIPWSREDDAISVTDDGATTYTLPFTFPWFGRAITAISVNTNGLVELLEVGESCAECADFATHFDHDHIAKNIDAVFAADDDLVTSVAVAGFADRVEISWVGRTAADTGFADGQPLAFRVLLFADGRVRWQFFDMAYGAFGADLFSGIYDAVKNLELEVPGGSRGFHGTAVDVAFEFDPATKAIASIPWDGRDTSIAATDDGHTRYTLPFPFPWFGRAITAVDVNTNGLVELLENGESCAECALPLTHAAGRHVTGHLDALFAANDDLATEVVIDGAADRVTIRWVGSTKLDAAFVDHPLAIELALFADGRVRWKLFDLSVAARSGDLFSGLYDGVRDVGEEVFDGSTAFVDAALDRVLSFSGAVEGPPGGPRCTNGIDDDGDGLVDAADPDCHGCGDGQPDAGEACDDGNATNGDGCDANCTVSACGNGVLAPDEACDPAAASTGCGLHELCQAPGSAHPCTCLTILDHFLGYATKPTRGRLCVAGAPQNVGGACADESACGGTAGVTNLCAPNAPPKNLSVTLASALARATYVVQKAAALYTPADVDADTVGDAAADLRGLTIKAAPRRCVAMSLQHAGMACRRENDCGGTRRVTSFCTAQPKALPTAGIIVTNVLHPHGELVLDAAALDRLLVPAAASLLGPIDPLDPAVHTLDAFACAKAEPRKGAAPFPKGLRLTVADQLGSPVVYELKKPSRLCAPASVAGGDVVAPTTFLLCYQAKPAKGQVGHPPTNGIFIGDALGRERMDTVKEEELCLRSTTNLP